MRMEVDMDKEIEAFRKEVLVWRGEGGQGRRRYPGGMKAKALQLAAALRKRGLTMAAAAKQLGVAVSMLYAWKKPPKGARMVPVKIVPAAMAAPSALTITTVRMLSPRGYRVEVPNVATAVALLRELG
jgi:transposase-like protein